MLPHWETQSPTPTIQRTLVISAGPLAAETSDLLKQRCALPPPVEPAVAFVDLDQLAEGHDDDLASSLKTAVERVSGTTVREQLADQGWRLDRLSELAVFVVWDAAHVGGKHTPEDVAVRVSEVTRRVLGVNTAVMLLLILADFDDPDGRGALRGWTMDLHPFQRGIMLLSSVNQDGLKLTPASALGEKTAALLYALIATPARDLPEQWWTRYSPDAGSALASMGVSVWQWPLEAARAWVSGRWCKRVVQAWRMAERDSEPAATAKAVAWMAAVGMGVQEMAERLQPYVSAVHIPLWQHPQPWLLRDMLAQQARRAQTLDAFLPDAVAIVTAELDAFLTDCEQALLQHCRAALDEQAAGGLAAAVRFCEVVGTTLAEQDLRTADRREQIVQEMAARSSEMAALAEEIQRRMQTWPQDGLAGWGWLLLRPWRWPAVGMGYWQLDQLGQQLTQLIRLQAQRERDLVIVSVMAHAIQRWQRWTSHVVSQLDELGMMLGAVAKSLPEQDDEHGWHALLDACESPAIEAAGAAAVLGGLGQFLMNPDDDLLRTGLQDIAAERAIAIVPTTAVKAWAWLLREEAERRRWWQDAWEDAAPLWRYDVAQLPEFERVQQFQTTAVCASEVSGLQETAVLDAAGTDLAWIATVQPQEIVVIRASLGLPQPVCDERRGA